MNPGKVVDAFRADDNLRLGTDFRPPARRHALPVPGGRWRLHARHAPLRRRRRVSPRARGHDVSQLPRHPRGDAQHPRSGAPAVRDDARAGARRLERRAHPRVARPLPRLQGLQGRLPDQRRRRDLQGGVPVPLLRGTPAAGRRLFDGAHPLVGAPGRAARQASPTPSRRRPLTAPLFKRLGGVAPQRRVPSFAAQTFKQLWRRPCAAKPGRAAGGALARHLQRPLLPRDGAGRRRGAGGARLPGGRPRGGRLLRPAALRLRHADRRQAALAERSARAAGRDCRRNTGGRARAVVRLGLPRRDDQPLAARSRRSAPAVADVPLRRVPHQARPSGAAGQAVAKSRRPRPLSSQVAVRAGTTSNSSCRRSASTSRCSTRVAAGWPARSASSAAKNIGCRSRLASSTSCPRCAPPIPRRSS